MKIAIAQINCTVGDLAGNSAKIAEYARRARDAGADLLLTPELGLSGYPPEDLLLRDGFYRACDRALEDLAHRVRGIPVVVGHPRQVEEGRFNAASVIRDGKLIATYHKQKLPNYTVFDEMRYFDSGDRPCTFPVAGVPVGINICADVWEKGAAGRARAAGAELLVTLNASPYHINKQLTRYEAILERVEETGLPIVYANMVGGQDELVFDGASFVMSRHGDITHQLPLFEECLGMVEFANGTPVPGDVVPPQSLEANVYKALLVGVRDYVGKNGFPGVLIGLSGGIDSALTLAIAVDALGPGKVRAVMMPSQYTADMSVEDARAMVGGLGVRYAELPIKPVFDRFLDTLAGEFQGLPADATEENIQARIRGTLMMALSNKFGSIVLTTGNKSEMAVGYATLYGDMAGGFAVLKDISKTMVYRLARYRNGLGRVIPERIITRPPSAELRANQTDQDSLPPYDLLDQIMEAYMERDLSIQEILAQGYPEAEVRRVVNLLHVSEYKRRQAPVGIRVTSRGFGKDWRYPITSKFRDEA